MRPLIVWAVVLSAGSIGLAQSTEDTARRNLKDATTEMKKEIKKRTHVEKCRACNGRGYFRSEQREVVGQTPFGEHVQSRTTRRKCETCGGTPAWLVANDTSSCQDVLTTMRMIQDFEAEILAYEKASRVRGNTWKEAQEQLSVLTQALLKQIRSVALSGGADEVIRQGDGKFLCMVTVREPIVEIDGQRYARVEVTGGNVDVAIPVDVPLGIEDNKYWLLGEATDKTVTYRTVAGAARTVRVITPSSETEELLRMLPTIAKETIRPPEQNR